MLLLRWRNVDLVLARRQVIQEKLRDSIHQHDSGRWVGHAVAASWKWHYFYILPLGNQRINNFKRVCKVYVVIARAVSNEQRPAQLRGIGYRRRSYIVLLIFRQQAHIPLCIY